LTDVFVRWLDSLIFNDEVDAYKSWILFLIFVSILVLISGVVLLTHKKPEPLPNTPLPSAKILSARRRSKHLRPVNDEEGRPEDANEHDALYSVGDGSDSEDLDLEAGDEDADHHQNPMKLQHQPKGLNHGETYDNRAPTPGGGGSDKRVHWASTSSERERRGLMSGDNDSEPPNPRFPDSDQRSKSLGLSDRMSAASSSSMINLSHDPFKDNDSGEFGDWQGVPTSRTV
jgi:hypothetical protein